MITVDTENEKVLIEYGNGSIMGFGHIVTDDGIGQYSLLSTDPHPIGQDCQNFDKIVGKTAEEIGASVVFTFSKIESLDILVKGLLSVRKDMPGGALVDAGKHPDLVKWEEEHNCQLFIGSKIKVKPTAEYYSERHDKGSVYMVTNLYVDSGGLNLGINDDSGSDKYRCDTDGFYIADVEPA